MPSNPLHPPGSESEQRRHRHLQQCRSFPALDYDYGEEDSEEWETENEESDEPDADGGSTEEDDEDSVK